jgi:hypothetical protein
MLYDNRKYIIFNISEIHKINFSEILETSADTLRKSVDDNSSFIKWEGEDPSFIELLSTKSGPYTHSEILNILSTSEWTEPNVINM